MKTNGRSTQVSTQQIEQIARDACTQITVPSEMDMSYHVIILSFVAIQYFDFVAEGNRGIIIKRQTLHKSWVLCCKDSPTPRVYHQIRSITETHVFYVWYLKKIDEIVSSLTVCMQLCTSCVIVNRPQRGSEDSCPADKKEGLPRHCDMENAELPWSNHEDRAELLSSSSSLHGPNLKT